MSKDYLSVIYNQKRTPLTDYPDKMTQYLCERFNLEAGEKLLEVGCGRGDFLRSFAKQGLACSALDIEPSTQELLKGFDIRLCDVSHEPFPYEDQSFDIVYHKSLIEHMFDPRHLMSESLRVLKPGGKVLFLTPEWVSCKDVFYEDITHCRPYTLGALEDLMAMSDVEHILVENFRQLPQNWSYPALEIVSKGLGLFLSTRQARWLTKKTGIKFFRFSVELMLLAYAVKPATKAAPSPQLV